MEKTKTQKQKIINKNEKTETPKRNTNITKTEPK